MFRWKNRYKDSFFDNKIYDKDQQKVIMDNHDYLLVVAGAGSGKTTTIVGKIEYLIEKMGYQENEILCLSFTNETVNNLKKKIKYQVDVFTFHKLALNILKDYHVYYSIAQDNLINYITDEYFYSFVEIEKMYSYFNCHDKDEILKSEYLKKTKLLIISLISKIKSNNVKVKELRKIKNKLDKHDKIFFLFALEILYLYQEELQSILQIDFDDMITYATSLIEKNHIKRQYRYIIIDEYQDISLIRFQLIKELVKKLHCKLMCVGDDCQAIYGFSGSKVAYFIDFLKYYPSSFRLDIRTTYRNSYQLATIANKFVQKNPYQLRKRVITKFLYRYPIVLVYYEENNYLETYQNILNYLYLENEKNILVLGRYNHDIEFVKKKRHKGLNMKYLTVHMAKGLEEDNVIVLKMDNSYLGFPSKIEESKLFQLIENNNEEIDYAEERRLFYVAMTRSRKRVYLLVSKKSPSLFIKEIESRCVELILSAKD